jgi:hypothetical protein
MASAAMRGLVDVGWQPQRASFVVILGTGNDERWASKSHQSPAGSTEGSEPDASRSAAVLIKAH